MYEVAGHFYSLGRIVMAVAQREGSPSCGIKLSGVYVHLSKDQGLQLCARLLKPYLDRMSLVDTLKIWKSVPPYQPYISDIEQILTR